MYGNSAHVIRQNFDFAGMQSGSNVQTKGTHAVADSFRAPDATGRTVERGEKAVSECLDFFATESGEFPAHACVMRL